MLGIDDWLFRNADYLYCNEDCVHCTDNECKDRLVEYEGIEQERETDFKTCDKRID